MYMLDLNEPQMIEMSQTAAHHSHSDARTCTCTRTHTHKFNSTRFPLCASVSYLCTDYTFLFEGKRIKM